MISYTELRALDGAINRKTTYVYDIDKYFTEEFWEAANEAGDEGDCEDAMLAKIRILLKAGVSIKDIRIVTCFMPPYSTHEEKSKRGHAVLFVMTEDGEFCCDFDPNRPPKATDMIDYELHKLQIAGTTKFEWAQGADRSFG